MGRSNPLTSVSRKRVASRTNGRQTELFDSETERQAKRISRQQKKLEKTTGISNIVALKDPYGQRVIKLQDIERIAPLTDTQNDFFQSWANNDAEGYALYGSAGTGKTFIALYHALLAVLAPESEYKKIIIVRSVVQTRNMGYLPGTADEKLEPFEQPYENIVYDLTHKRGAYQKLKDMGKIEFYSTSFLRGTTFHDCIVIFDEAQNTTFQEANTIATRMGNNSKLIICGDGAQNDLTTSKNDVSGFRNFIDVTRKMPEFRNFRFNSSDICRSAFVKSWIVTCEQLGLM